MKTQKFYPKISVSHKAFPKRAFQQSTSCSNLITMTIRKKLFPAPKHPSKSKFKIHKSLGKNILLSTHDCQQNPQNRKKRILFSRYSCHHKKLLTVFFSLFAKLFFLSSYFERIQHKSFMCFKITFLMDYRKMWSRKKEENVQRKLRGKNVVE